MTEPLVCAVMLVNGRPEMVRRAVASFRVQTYTPRLLFIYDTGTHPVFADICVELGGGNGAYEYCAQMVHPNPSIGALRNDAIRRASAASEIICHWDSDDVSHPQRIAEQVALLQSSGADCVGYREAVFCDSRQKSKPNGEEVAGPLGWHPVFTFQGVNEAWIYRSPDTTYAIGASLCYWRAVWQRVPFADLPKPGSNHSEDWHFVKRVKTLGVSGIGEDGEPRLICSVHGQNSANYSWLGKNKRLRAAQFDEYCRQRMELK